MSAFVKKTSFTIILQCSSNTRQKNLQRIVEIVGKEGKDPKKKKSFAFSKSSNPLLLASLQVLVTPVFWALQLLPRPASNSATGKIGGTGCNFCCLTCPNRHLLCFIRSQHVFTDSCTQQCQLLLRYVCFRYLILQEFRK